MAFVVCSPDTAPSACQQAGPPTVEEFGIYD